MHAASYSPPAAQVQSRDHVDLRTFDQGVYVCIHSFSQSFNHSSIRPSNRSFIHSLIHSSIESCHSQQQQTCHPTWTWYSGMTLALVDLSAAVHHDSEHKLEMAWCCK